MYASWKRRNWRLCDCYSVNFVLAPKPNLLHILNTRLYCSFHSVLGFSNVPFKPTCLGYYFLSNIEIAQKWLCIFKIVIQLHNFKFAQLSFEFAQTCKYCGKTYGKYSFQKTVEPISPFFPSSSNTFTCRCVLPVADHMFAMGVQQEEDEKEGCLFRSRQLSVWLCGSESNLHQWRWCVQETTWFWRSLQ